jgi:anti-sigma factor RsiW
MFGHVVNQLAAYAEDQLDEQDRTRVDRHLNACDHCRRELERIRTGIRLASTLTAEAMPEAVAARIKREFAVGTTRVAPFITWRRVAAAAAVVFMVIGLYWHLNRPWIQLHAAAAPTRFEEEGRRLHDRIKSGDVPLAFHSRDEQALWRWLADQRAPVTSMVISRPESERPHFVPIGAAVHTLDGARTSVLSYRIDGRPVTLALASSDAVPDAPTAGWWSKRVSHRSDAEGANTLTWTVGGGTYVMVSELEGSGQRACLICHTSPRFVGALARLSR